MDNTIFDNNKNQIVEELILILDNFENMDRNEIDIYYYPWIYGGPDKENDPKYDKYKFITLKDIVHNEKLTKKFCDSYYNKAYEHEWCYECHVPNGDKRGFLNIIPKYMSTYTNLVKLELMFSEINKIENLPENIKYLNLSHNNIKKIENIPSKVKWLTLSNNKITKIENIPKSVENLIIIQNEHYHNPNCIINKIENLPDNIQYLTLSWEYVTDIGNLDNVNNNIEILIHNQNIDITKIPKKIRLKLLNEPKSIEIKKYADEVNCMYDVFRRWKHIYNHNSLLKKYDIHEEDNDDTITKLIKLYNCLTIKLYLYDKSILHIHDSLDELISSNNKSIINYINKNKKNFVYILIMEKVNNITFNITNLEEKITFNYKHTNFKSPRKISKKYVIEYNPYNIYEGKLYSFFLELLKNDNFIFSNNLFYDDYPNLKDNDNDNFEDEDY
jgi:hypothetical protein